MLFVTKRILMMATLLTFTSTGFGKVKLDDYSSGMNKLGWEISTQVAKPGENSIYSPLSTSQALAMTYLGSDGNNKVEMAKVLGFSNFSDLDLLESNEAFSKILSSVPEIIEQNYNEQSGQWERSKKLAYEFNMANSLWNNKDAKGTQVVKAFQSNLNKYFGSEMTPISFNSEGAEKINDWVSETTNKKIQKLLAPDSLDEDGRLVLVNGVHLKAAWDVTFEKYKTGDKPFSNNEGTVNAVSYTHLTLPTILLV